MKKLLGTLILVSIFYCGFSQISAEFQARANDATQIRLESNDGNELFDLRLNNDGILRIIANGDTNDEVLQIDDDSENVGIGIDANAVIRLRSHYNQISDGPTTGLQGDAQGGGSGSRFGVFGTAGNNTGNRYGVYGSVSTGTGRWGVYCSGNFYHTGSFTSTSDGRLKSNIQDIDQVLSTIMNLKPRRYIFNQDVKGIELAKGPQIGFVAQELEKVLPDLVETNLHDLIDKESEGDYTKMEIKSINYIAMIPLLTKAIQEQQALIEKLESRITELESKE